MRRIFMSPSQLHPITTQHSHSALLLLASLVQAGPAIFYSCKVAGDCGTIAVSENVQRILGYAPEDFTGDPGFWAIRIHPEDSERVFAGIPRLFHEDEQTIDYRFRHADGHYLWLRDQMKLERDADGSPLRILGCWLEINGSQRGGRFAALTVSGTRETTTTETTGGNHEKQI